MNIIFNNTFTHNHNQCYLDNERVKAQSDLRNDGVYRAIIIPILLDSKL